MLSNNPILRAGKLLVHAHLTRIQDLLLHAHVRNHMPMLLATAYPAICGGRRARNGLGLNGEHMPLLFPIYAFICFLPRRGVVKGIRRCSTMHVSSWYLLYGNFAVPCLLSLAAYDECPVYERCVQVRRSTCALPMLVVDV